MDNQVDYRTISRLSTEVEELKKENKRLRKALEYYADIRFWERCNQTHYTNFTRDKERLGLMYYGGRKAREALALKE